MDAIDAALAAGNLPTDASLVAVIPGFKGKGAGGAVKMKNYRYFGLTCTFGRLFRRFLAHRLMISLLRFLPKTFFGCMEGPMTIHYVY